MTKGNAAGPTKRRNATRLATGGVSRVISRSGHRKFTQDTPASHGRTRSDHLPKWLRRRRGHLRRRGIGESRQSLGKTGCRRVSPQSSSRQWSQTMILRLTQRLRSGCARRWRAAHDEAAHLHQRVGAPMKYAWRHLVVERAPSFIKWTFTRKLPSPVHGVETNSSILMRAAKRFSSWLTLKC